MVFGIKNVDLKGINLKNFYEWPIYGRAVIFIGVCLVVFYLGYLLDFSAFSDQIIQQYKQEQDLKQQVSSIFRNEEDMRAVVSQYPEIMKLLNHWQDQLANASSLPDLMNQILKVGAVNHIQFSLFAPGNKEQKDDYFRVPIKVVMQGSYAQIANFMSQVANMPQLVAIGNFTLARQETLATADKKTEDEATKANRLTGELTLEVYYLATKK